MRQLRATTEHITLKTIDTVTVQANRLSTGEFDNVIGLSDPDADLMTMVFEDIHFIKWSSMIMPQEAQLQLAGFDPANRHRRFHIDRQDPDASNLGLGRKAFLKHDVADAVELHSEAGDHDPVIVWRRPLKDEEPYNRIISYFPNDDQSFPAGLHGLIEATLLPERQPANLQRTLDIFHTIYTEYAGVVVDRLF